MKNRCKINGMSVGVKERFVGLCPGAVLVDEALGPIRLVPMTQAYVGQVEAQAVRHKGVSYKDNTALPSILWLAWVRS